MSKVYFFCHFIPICLYFPFAADPLNSFTLEDGQYHSEPSYICRFALGVAVYAAVALLQVVFWCFLVNNLVEDKLKQFGDLCSLANISVFAMANSNFGYYIHGKSGLATNSFFSVSFL